MYWKLNKISDDGHSVDYAYSFECDSFTGRIRFNRQTETSECVQLAQNDTAQNVQRLFRHLWKVVMQENAPGTRTIAIG